MWFLHAIVLICTGVSKKKKNERSPITEKTSISNQVPAASSKETGTPQTVAIHDTIGGDLFPRGGTAGGRAGEGKIHLRSTLRITLKNHRGLQDSRPPGITDVVEFDGP
ncbi:hypothetical protein FQA47_002957 [Oryzias melastigma]|uniref:Uncharacterized protein n=1 Tax=Oryzias melastigma TaxID=30732 RepID=A0A834F4R0_ORYME|nr:hypothetical protein FQA47_002957 [Oryzias melastigma]